MPWAVILTTLTLALVSAGLVFLRAWEPWQAFLAVGVTAAGIIFTLLCTLLLFTARTDRADIRQAFMATLLDDLHQALKYLRIRKGP